MAAGGLTGILGTILYPLIRKRIGLERTGLLGFFFEIAMLSLCVASIWAPGSPFDPFYWMREPPVENSMTNTSVSGDRALFDYSQSNETVINQNDTITLSFDLTTQEFANATTGASATAETLKADKYNCDDGRSWTQFISVGLLMSGIIGARCGKFAVILALCNGSIFRGETKHYSYGATCF